jgi:predicted ATPase/DNA-binding SARP family transcriptional activator/Tfp pilus assembly protein PilF
MSVRLFLFGSPAIEYGGKSFALPFERRSQLLALLAMKRTWVGRAELASMLWPDQSSKLAYTNLRKTLFRLQSLPWSPRVEAQGSALRFEAETDVSAFEAALREKRIADALPMRRGELLVGLEDDANEAWSSWLNFERDRLRVAWRGAALERLAADIDPVDGVELSARLLDADPLDEAALRTHLSWLARDGQGGRARQVYRDFVRRIEEDLGLAPSADLKALNDSLGRPVESSEPVLDAAPGVTEDGFVGRSAELRRIAELMAGGECRLLSLVGPGGVGKTRLARRALRSLAPAYPDGAVFVPLEDLASSGDFGGRLARELEVSVSGRAEPLDQVIGFLRERRMLLVLDNFEHLTAAAPMLDRLLQASSRLKIIVTSRVRLAVAAEWMFPLDGLPCPEIEDQDRIEAFDAARLFIQAARRVEPALLPAAEAAAIVDICRQVEGLPLALQLAAAWTRVLSCEAIAAELRQGTELLRAVDAAHPAKHASFEQVFDQSWRLLSALEREALSRLSVFRGGFTAEAARAVASAPLPVLGALADKSLLRKDHTRLHLHSLVQQLAGARLGDGEGRSASEQTHARYFNDLLHQLRRAVENGDREALRQIDAEFENCRVAWRWSAAHRATLDLARSLHALTHYCDHRSRFEEGLKLLRDALASPSAQGDSNLRALLLGKAAHLEYRLDRYADAMATARLGLEIVDAAADADARAQCLKVIATCQLRLGNHEDAGRCFEEALKLAPECSDVRHRAAMLSGLALVQKGLGNYDGALGLSIEALDQQRRLGDVASEALSLNNLAALHIERQEFASAGEYLKPALALSDRHGLAATRGAVLANLTLVAWNSGESDAAQAYGARALEQAQANGNRFLVSYLRFQFARFALLRSALGAARAEIRVGMELAIAIGRPALLMEGVACLAEILAAQGETVCARSVLHFAMDHPVTAPLERDVLQRALARLPAAEQAQAPWPGLSLEELAHRIVVESDVAYVPLIAALGGTS